MVFSQLEQSFTVPKRSKTRPGTLQIFAFAQQETLIGFADSHVLATYPFRQGAFENARELRRHQYNPLSQQAAEVLHTHSRTCRRLNPEGKLYTCGCGLLLQGWAGRCRVVGFRILLCFKPRSTSRPAMPSLNASQPPTPVSGRAKPRANGLLWTDLLKHFKITELKPTMAA